MILLWYGMWIIRKKTKNMAINNGSITICEERIEQVKAHKYLGGVVTEDLRYYQEVKSRIG